MSLPGLIEKIWKKGEFPELRTVVEVEPRTLVKISLTIVLTILFLTIATKFINRYA
jgi:hypothetical protein